MTFYISGRKRSFKCLFFLICNFNVGTTSFCLIYDFSFFFNFLHIFYSHFIFTLGFVNWNSCHTFKRVHKCEMFVRGRVSIINNKHFSLTTSDPHIGRKKNTHTHTQKIWKTREINMYAKCIWYWHRTIVACTSYVRPSSQMSERFMDLFIIFFIKNKKVNNGNRMRSTHETSRMG